MIYNSMLEHRFKRSQRHQSLIDHHPREEQWPIGVDIMR